MPRWVLYLEHFANHVALQLISPKIPKIKIGQHFYFKKTFRYPYFLQANFVSDAPFQNCELFYFQNYSGLRSWLSSRLSQNGAILKLK